ncbi:F-box/LRR-repeat protein At3g48880-like [Oryza sativa Japonica Group]|uniref:F-box domain containing protein, expressed n=5 Tax=Oryza TaxID=4527 RepID=Q10I71_ORYSJ|nr:F-box protein FBW2 [Oryza sativa Japonica Group]XP_015631213.1 F-box protein FBW2 [Oryza sativa Japonica Group]XP_015631214.1 F-box protein FBW2 [Oryza sativa Japonica Group]XP_015631215.1 F-box protein FBW2 [Oryza sativa Japonica Group]XP_015631216.1 F-box protein FBW2 [Oryza sativa Japonica Group]XP_015631217.1 F-box protein FBW2 [Oryza sativa Japonica Group]XP_015631218.1 F-box protein FBW2 [Oryza sativa Japonica Group]XP_015631219.1 F-box protein FBW2 [Oryza sativa Japonica Group]XP_|eukprot:NP_001050490.1 Os03g0562200 [Oryza sativa Japonica Group]
MASSSPPVRPWADLQHDLLVMIMSRVGLPDLLSGGATRACSAWRASARDPLVWRRVDLRDWAVLTSARRRLAAGDGEAAAAGRGRVPLQAALCSVLEIVVRRAAGRMEALLLPEFADEEHLLFLAQRNPNLHYFSLPATCITYDQFRKAIDKLQFLKGMAVDEGLINHDVLSHVHQCCPDFLELKVFALYVDEEMASIICNSLPRLKKLEIPNSDMSCAAIIKFLDCLEELEYLDISGYETSAISSAVLQKASRLNIFIWNSKFELGEFTDCSNCGEHCINPQEPCKCVMEHRVMDWLAGPSQPS